MTYTEEHIVELKRSFPDNAIQTAEEAGIKYFLIPSVALPDGCTPAISDILYCPTPRDGYTSRIFFPEKIQTKQTLNWNTSCVILGRQWFAYSWKIDDVMTPLETLFVHLRALK